MAWKGGGWNVSEDERRNDAAGGPGAQEGLGRQRELDLGGSTVGGNGYDAWQAQRREALRLAGQALGLPLGQVVHVELKDGCVLKGVLRLAKEELFIEASRAPGRSPLLRVDRCTFGLGDIVSCVQAG